VLLPFLNHPIFAISTPNTSQFEIVRAIPFNNTILSSLTIDPISDLVYVAGMPDYSYNDSSISCLEHNTNSSDMPCSVIYVLDGGTGQIHDIIRLRSGEIIHDMDINPDLGKIYAAGEFNYLENNSEPIQYEDDVVYIINQISFVNNTNQNLSQPITANDIQRIRLYGEQEEGKEGDMSSIAVDTRVDTIYAGIRYFQGGREGVFVINDNSDSTYDTSIIGKKPNTNTTKFIPLGETGPDQILVNDKTNVIYVSLKNDNFVALIDNGSNNTAVVRDKIILQKPRAMSINPSIERLYVASGDSNWFNVIDMNTNKVLSTNTQIAYPIASVVNNVTNQVYVADCHFCDNYDFTNGTSIYELNSTGSTINWKTYEDVNLVENELEINPSINKLYAIGTDQSEISNLYVMDLH
jgi:DNA-binding beta-propeller fold protein YncE